MARTLYLQGLAKLAGLPFDLGDAAELALLFSENAGLQIDHLLIAVTLLRRDVSTLPLCGHLQAQAVHPPHHPHRNERDDQPWNPPHHEPASAARAHSRRATRSSAPL